MHYRPTTEMTSDILTKPLPPKQFMHLRPKLLGMTAITDLYPPLKGWDFKG